jgi:hypothetical protein
MAAMSCLPEEYTNRAIEAARGECGHIEDDADRTLAATDKTVTSPSSTIIVHPRHADEAYDLSPAVCPEFAEIGDHCTGE